MIRYPFGLHFLGGDMAWRVKDAGQLDLSICTMLELLKGWFVSFFSSFFSLADILLGRFRF